MKLVDTYPKNVPVSIAAELMGVSPQFLRIGLRNKRFSFGSAVKMSTHWTYHISPLSLMSYLGAEVNQ